MKRVNVFLMCLVGVLLASCKGCEGGEVAMALSPEELRLQRIALIDSTTIQTLVRLDSIEGYDRLEDLSAEAWMLVDDSTGMVKGAIRWIPYILLKMYL